MFERLKDGDEVGIVAPASSVTADQLAPAVAWLNSIGYRVRLGASIGKVDRFLAGADEDRATDLHGMFENDDVKAIFAARGGYGSSRLLDRIDWGLLARKPKPFVGFSDTTALQIGMYALADLPSWTGIALRSDVADKAPADSLRHDLTRALRFGASDPIVGLRHVDNLSGTLIGGCLSLVTHLVGTPFMPDLAGHVLVIEDVGESPYRIDRMLTQLLHSNVLSSAAACAIGTFYRCEGDAEDGTVEEVVADFRRKCPCPIVEGLPYGHGSGRRLLPLGVKVAIEDGTMTFEEIEG